MELILQILMIFIFLNSVFKLSFWKYWQIALFSIICSMFVLFTCSYSIQQSKTQLIDYLNNTIILQNMAVLITLESAFCFAFCIVALKKKFGQKRKRYIELLAWYPGLLIFPVLFYLQTQLIFSLPGTAFMTTSGIFAITVLVLLFGSTYFIRRFFPETDFRLEIHFLLSLFVCVIGLITTVNGHTTYRVAEAPINIRAIIFSVIIFLFAFAVGMFWDKIKWRLKRNRKQQINKH